jgi:hypothetical protein
MIQQIILLLCSLERTSSFHTLELWVQVAVQLLMTFEIGSETEQTRTTWTFVLSLVSSLMTSEEC